MSEFFDGTWVLLTVVAGCAVYLWSCRRRRIAFERDVRLGKTRISDHIVRVTDG